MIRYRHIILSKDVKDRAKSMHGLYQLLYNDPDRTEHTDEVLLTPEFALWSVLAIQPYHMGSRDRVLDNYHKSNYTVHQKHVEFIGSMKNENK